MKVSNLFIYPVKGLRGISVRDARIDALGLTGDRRFLVIDQQGKMLTQRDLPGMALIETELTSTHLILRAPKSYPCNIVQRSSETARQYTVAVWKSDGLIADDCGDEPAEWLSAALGLPCRLVRIGPKFRRAVLDAERARPDDVVSFADGYPFLLVSEASLDDLNQRLTTGGESAIPMDRFRPSIVITGCSAFAEDSWPTLTIGGVKFRAGGPCSRCIVTTTDQSTGIRGKEPLRTLATFRRDSLHPSAVNFGQNLIHETKAGTIHVGDPVEVGAQ